MLGQPVSMLIPQVARRPAARAAARGRDGHRSRAHGHRDAARAWRRGHVRRVLRRRARGAADRRPRDASGTCRRSSARTCAIFPVDAETLRYLEFTGRPQERIELVEAYCREQGLWHDADAPEPRYSRSDRARSRRGRAEPRGPAPPAGPGRRSSDARAAFEEALADFVSNGEEPEDAYDEAARSRIPPPIRPRTESPARRAERQHRR